MKKIGKYFFFIFIFLNILILVGGKSWIYKAISITYLKGHSSSYISDFVYFPSKIIDKGKHQEWLTSKNYNQAALPEFIKSTNKELETTAFLIIINDSIIYEEYFHGYSKDSASNSFSVAKSWISTLVGIAFKEGQIQSLNQSISDFLPQYSTEKERKITIKHLLTMSSGFNWNENYYNPLGKTAEAYYGTNLNKLVTGLKSIEPPGRVFKYHSCNTQLLSFIIERATGKSVNEYASEKLWIPMGAKHPGFWNTDNKGGDEKAFCCINSNARDFARLAKLYMNFGKWNGQKIIDSNYVVQATSPADLLKPDGKKNKNYGYHFWISNHNDLKIYYMRGLWGQYVVCIPEKKMIIVRLGRKQGRLLKSGHYEDFYQFIEAATEMYD